MITPSLSTANLKAILPQFRMSNGDGRASAAFHYKAAITWRRNISKSEWDHCVHTKSSENARLSAQQQAPFASAAAIRASWPIILSHLRARADA